VLVAPFAVTFGTRDTELQPDVLVARYGDLTAKNLPAAPLLAVEVRSPSTALLDLNLKKAAYERFGVESYWIVDPDAPSVVAYEMTERGYIEVARADDDEVAELSKPFAVRISPAGLRRGLDPD
jgi:Uma2 family endonuclease